MLDYGLGISPEQSPPTPTRDKVGVDVLWDRHREILRQVALGKTNAQIAEDMGVSSLTVASVKSSPLGQAQLSYLRRQADEAVQRTSARIAMLAPKAEAVLVEIMTNPESPYSVRANVAKDLLDRAGLGAVKKVEAHTFSQHVTDRDISELKKRLDAAGIIVQVEAQEESDAMVGNLGGALEREYSQSNDQGSSLENQEMDLVEIGQE